MCVRRFIASVAIVLIALAGFSTAVLSREFVKNENNGTVSCNTFCASQNGHQPVWGNQVGYCRSATNEYTGESDSCRSVPGLIPQGRQLTCVCNDDVIIKHGNNGTASCDAFCQGYQWGNASGRCVAGWNTRRNKPVPCSATTGDLGGPELTCTCRL